jgi:hypothetical protein
MTEKTTIRNSEEVKHIESLLDAAGVDYTVVYPTRQENVWQAEIMTGNLKRVTEKLEAAGFRDVSGQKDYLDDQPFIYARFTVPEQPAAPVQPADPELTATAAEINRLREDRRRQGQVIADRDAEIKRLRDELAALKRATVPTKATVAAVPEYRIVLDATESELARMEREGWRREHMQFAEDGTLRVVFRRCKQSPIQPQPEQRAAKHVEASAIIDHEPVASFRIPADALGAQHRRPERITTITTNQADLPDPALSAEEYTRALIHTKGLTPQEKTFLSIQHSMRRINAQRKPAAPFVYRPIPGVR